MSPRATSPIGTAAADASGGRRRRDPEYRAAQERLAPYEGIARLVIMRRAELGPPAKAFKDFLSLTFHGSPTSHPHPGTGSA